MRVLAIGVFVLACVLAWSGCGDSGPANPLGVGVEDLALGDAVWITSSGDRFEAVASYEQRPATDLHEGLTDVTLRSEGQGDAPDLEITITLPQVSEPVVHTDAGCSTFVWLSGYPRPIDGAEPDWMSCCAVRRVECSENDTYCSISEVGADGIRGEFRAKMYYFSGFRLWGTMSVRGVFHAVAPETSIPRGGL